MSQIHSIPTVVRNSRGLSISGTRVTLYAVMDHIKQSWPPHLIRDLYGLTDQQISDVMCYIRENRELVEAEYQQVLQEATTNEQYWRDHNREHFAKLSQRPPKPGMQKAWQKLQARKHALGMI